MRFLTSASMVALVLAGCLQTDPSDLSDKDPKDALGFEYYLPEDFPIEGFDLPTHKHSGPGSAAAHAADFQVDMVGLHACTADGRPGTERGFTDIAFHGIFAFVGHSRGFCILDVTDPTTPKFVSNYQGEPAADFEVSADGNFAFLLTQRNGAPVTPTSTDPTDHFPRGVVVVNVKDKKSPQFETYYQVLTNGVHTATPFQIGTRQMLSIQTYDWVPPVAVQAVPQQNAPYTQRVEIVELKATPLGRMNLEFVGRYSLDRPATEPLALLFPHDAYVQKHPVTGKLLLYIAYWDAGLVILDITDPTKPAKIAQYNQAAPSKYNAYHDVKVSEELIDGRHITVTGPELGSAVGEVGFFRIFDTTDPTKPVQLGAWTLPGVTGYSGGFLYSPHVFQVVNGRIYLAHNHGGVWVVDIHNETLLKEPKAAGYYFPHGDDRTASESNNVWGAYVHAGHIYATEATTGVHVLQWIGDRVEIVPAEMAAPAPQP